MPRRVTSLGPMAMRLLSSCRIGETRFTHSDPARSLIWCGLTSIPGEIMLPGRGVAALYRAAFGETPSACDVPATEETEIFALPEIHSRTI
jgi:hypothetical protein